MKVSVLIGTYNHEKFIAQALDSVLMQQTSFDYEIVIGEDCSTDNTRNILKDYERRYPDKIRLLLREKNLGAIRNGMETLESCRGEYVATLEGDDYWTDPLKLQIQADLLDKNKDDVMCFHNAEVVYENGSGNKSHLLNVNQKEIVGIDDLIGETEICFIATASMMFRRRAVPAFPAWVEKSKSGDIPLWILLAKQGNIRFIDRAMSVWRRQPGGQSFTDNYTDATFILNRIYMYTCISQELGYRHKKIINRNLARYYLMLSDCHQSRNKYLKRKYYALKAAFLAPPRNTKEFKKIAKVVAPQFFLKVYSMFLSNATKS